MTLSPFRERESTVLSDRVLEAYFNQPAPGPKTVSPMALRLLLVGLIVVLGVVVAGLRVLSAAPGGPDHPPTWDPHVAPYVSVVEHLRGLTFVRPVFVDLLTDEAFEADRAAELPDAPQSQGYYSYDRERIRLRGESLTPLLTSVLVHELTHALQDQRFGLGLRLDLLRDDDTAFQALGSILEADARRVESRWRDTLDKGTRRTVKNALAEETWEPDLGGGMLPTALTRGRSTLDDLGQGLVTSAYRTGGNAAVDDLLRRPPTTQEHLLDPWTLVGDQQDAIGVREAHVAPTDRSVEAGTFGAVGWLVLLGGRLPAGQALEASLGWGGDAYQLVERRGGKTCLRINYTGDTPTDTREMSAALHAWAGAAPARITNVSREGSLVRFETCEAAALGQPTSGSALAVRLALARNHLTASLVSAGARWAEARCGADRLAQILTVAELDDVRVQGPRAQRVLAGCRNT